MYEVMISQETPEQEKWRIQEALTNYCKLDTLAMVKLREKLLDNNTTRTTGD